MGLETNWNVCNKPSNQHIRGKVHQRRKDHARSWLDIASSSQEWIGNPSGISPKLNLYNFFYYFKDVLIMNVIE